MLRGAIADLAACRALETIPTEIIRAGSFIARDALGDRQAWNRRQIHQGVDREDLWQYHFPAVLWAKHFWDDEPKRSRKILRLITLGHLAQCDRPVAARPPVVSKNYLIYALDPTTPAPLDRIRPERLAAWADASGCRNALQDPSSDLGTNAACRSQLDTLRLRLAERAYALEHAGQPAPTCGDLLPTYLDALPPGDPLAAL